jgi:hypothetical protein
MPAPAAVRALVALLLLAACAPADRAADVAEADPDCFGSRVLSFHDLMAEVVIPAGETCDSGSFVVHFTRGDDTLASLTEAREGTVGFIGTSDVDGDGRGEFFIATSALDPERRGAIFAYTDSPDGPVRMPIVDPHAEPREGYAGGDRFGFGGADQLVWAYPRAAGDSAWFGYSFSEARWTHVERPDWLR